MNVFAVFGMMSIVLFGIALSFVSIIYRGIKTLLQFKKDPYGNPFRRCCKKCGQCQGLYEDFNNSKHQWWEVQGKIKDEKCECHKYVSECTWQERV